MSISEKPPNSAAAAAAAKPQELSRKLTRAEHMARHKELHSALDELFADYLVHHFKQRRCLEMSVLELMNWSFEQTKNPTEAERDD